MILYYLCPVIITIAMTITVTITTAISYSIAFPCLSLALHPISNQTHQTKQPYQVVHHVSQFRPSSEGFGIVEVSPRDHVGKYSLVNVVILKW